MVLLELNIKLVIAQGSLNLTQKEEKIYKIYVHTFKVIQYVLWNSVGHLEDYNLYNKIIIIFYSIRL